MRFLWPDMLWLLVLVPALVAGYLFVLARRKRQALRYSSLVLIRQALGPGQRWRRHVPPALFLAAVAAAMVAAARPSAVVTLPSQYMTLIMAMDVSRSMMATDVAPNRISSAQAAAKAFIDGLPSNVRVGIVSFAASTAVVQTVTDRHEDLIAAVDRFELQRGTATGNGLLAALGQLLPDAGIEVEPTYGYAFGPYGDNPAQPRARQQAPKDFVPVAPGSYTGGGIVLLSDGRRTVGPDPLKVARVAADHGVRVFTVGFGSKNPNPNDLQGMSFFALLDEDTLKGVASITGGEYFYAGTAEDLKQVYNSLRAKFSLEARETEITALFSVLAVALLIAAAALSLWWFRTPVASAVRTPA